MNEDKIEQEILLKYFNSIGSVAEMLGEIEEQIKDLKETLISEKNHCSMRLDELTQLEKDSLNLDNVKGED